MFWISVNSHHGYECLQEVKQWIRSHSLEARFYLVIMNRHQVTRRLGAGYWKYNRSLVVWGPSWEARSSKYKQQPVNAHRTSWFNGTQNGSEGDHPELGCSLRMFRTASWSWAWWRQHLKAPRTVQGIPIWLHPRVMTLKPDNIYFEKSQFLHSYDEDDSTPDGVGVVIKAERAMEHSASPWRWYKCVLRQSWPREAACLSGKVTQHSGKVPGHVWEVTAALE